MAKVLEAIERAVRSVTDAELDLPTPNRGRDLRELVFNIHDPINAMRTAIDSGSYDWNTEDDRQRSRAYPTVADLAEFCRKTRLDWLARTSLVAEDEEEASVVTQRGTLTQRQVLESQAVHAAQHLRQIYEFLDGIGRPPVDRLQPMDLAPIELGAQVW